MLLDLFADNKLAFPCLCVLFLCDAWGFLFDTKHL